MCLRSRSLGHPRQILPIRGVTLIEALVTISVVGVLATLAAPNVSRLGSKPLPDTANQAAGVFRSARAKAISQTSPIKIKPKNRLAVPNGTSTGGLNTQLEVWRTTKTTAVCNAETDWVKDSALTEEYLTFAKGVTLTSTQIDNAVISVPTGWEICFNTRGMASTTSTSTNNFVGNNVILTFQQASDSKTQRVEIFPAGGIQVYDN
jgi:prepilin-type N-terminal cleavage/methylation domain-containing protein